MHRQGLHRALWRSVTASDALWQLLPTRSLATLSQGAASGTGAERRGYGSSSGSGPSGGSESGAGSAQKACRSSAKRDNLGDGSGAVAAAAAAAGAPTSSSSTSPSRPKKTPGSTKAAAAGASQGTASASASSSDGLDVALAQAAVRGREEAVLQLAQQGAAVNWRGRRGRTPLHLAASEGRVAAVRQLLQLGAARTAADDDGCTPLMLAAAAGKAGAVEALLQAGTLLLTSSSGSSAAAVAGTSEGSRALCLAAAAGHSRSVRLLLAAGVAADAPGQADGARPLHLAARGGHASSVRALAAAGADVEAADAAGSTPLVALVQGWQEARAEQFLSAAQALLRAGADPARCTALAAARGLRQLESTLHPAASAAPAGPAAQAEQQGIGSTGSGPEAEAGTQAVLEAELSGPVAPVAPVPPSPLPTLDRRSPWFGTLPLPGRSGSGGGLLTDEVLAARWEIPWGALSELQELPRGAGSFAQVYTGKWQRTPVAVKKFTVEERDGVPQLEETMQNLRQEVSVMACLRNHPNIVRFLGVCFDPPAIVMELCGRESLLDLLSKAVRDPTTARLLSWQCRVGMLLDAARGMLHIHEQGMIHRDLKSPNLLVDGKMTVQVADYSLSVFVDEAGIAPADKVMLSIHPRWLAPEVVSGKPASRSSDVFAFGIIMWELLTWVYPWAQHTGQGAAEGIEAALQRGERPEIPPLRDLPGPRAAAFAGMDVYLKLMQRCWAQEAERRPTFHEILDELEAMAEGAW